MQAVQYAKEKKLVPLSSAVLCSVSILSLCFHPVVTLSSMPDIFPVPFI